MFKKIIHLKDDFYYSPSHNTFFKSDSPDKVDFGNRELTKLTISGQEEVIFEYLLSRYNNGITVKKEELEKEFSEITRPYDKALDSLCNKQFKKTLGLHKFMWKDSGKVIICLAESPFTIAENLVRHILPLLKRPSYVFNYGRILSDYASDNADEPRSILLKWIDECKKTSSYDQKCVMIMERIGFLPAFGKKFEKKEFLKKAKELIYSFTESDVQEYGETDTLLLARNIIYAAIEYIEAQNDIITPGSNNANLQKTFEEMLHSFLAINISDIMWGNPLLLVVYYHYLGLVYYRNYLYNGNEDFLTFAKDAIEKALPKAKKADPGPQIWEAFLTYDLARICSELHEDKKAIENIQISVELREKLVNSEFFSDSIKSQLYFEYLLAKILETDINKKAKFISENDAQTEYSKIKNKAETITNFDTKLYIRHLLEDRMSNKDKER